VRWAAIALFFPIAPIAPILPIALLAFASPAFAQESGAAAPEAPPQLVHVTIAGAPQPAALESTLGDLLEHLPAAADGRPSRVGARFSLVDAIDPRSITDPPLDRSPGFARVWLDIRRDVAVVSIADTGWERIYVRRMPLPSGLDDVAREQVVHVVVSAIETLLAGGKIGIARAELVDEPEGAAPPTKAAPAPTPVAPALAPAEHAAPPPHAGPVLGAQLGVAYEVVSFAPGHEAHGPLASLRASASSGDWTGALSFSGQLRTPIVVDDAPIGLRLGVVALRLGFEVERRLTSRLALRAGVGPGLDVLDIEPRSRTRSADGVIAPGVTLEAARSRVSPVLRWTLGLDVGIAGAVHGFAAFVLDHDLDNRTYFVRDVDVDRNVLAPQAFRPGFMIGIAADLVPR
jgi:hypothetical protein